MAPLTNTIEVDRPREEVFGYVTDPTRFHEWQANVVDGRLDGPPPHRVGARCVTTRRFGGAEREVTSEITHIDPPSAWGVHGIDGPIRATVNVKVEPVTGDARSKLTIDLDFAGRGIGRLIVPLFVRPQARKEMRANLERLKQRLESVADPAA